MKLFFAGKTPRAEDPRGKSGKTSSYEVGSRIQLFLGHSNWALLTLDTRLLWQRTYIHLLAVPVRFPDNLKLKGFRGCRTNKS